MNKFGTWRAASIERGESNCEGLRLGKNGWVPLPKTSFTVIQQSTETVSKWDRVHKIVNCFILFFLFFLFFQPCHWTLTHTELCLNPHWEKHFHTLCYKAVMKRDFTAHMARRTTLIGYQVELWSGPEVDRHWHNLNNANHILLGHIK